MILAFTYSLACWHQERISILFNLMKVRIQVFSNPWKTVILLGNLIRCKKPSLREEITYLQEVLN
jgi:hypothetical protein